MAVTPMPKQSPMDAAQPGFPDSAKAITKSDTDTFATPVTIYVGTGGDVAVIPAKGSTSVLFKNVPDGACIPVRVIAVLATNTDASDFVAIY